MTNAEQKIAELEAELEETYRSITHFTNELEQTKERFESLSLHDGLTGLSNRALFDDRLEQAIVLAQRENRQLTVFMMDLDRFKEINDTLGHDAGDALLQEVAKRLVDATRRSDTIARLGGDEFAALLPTAENMEAAVTVAEKIIRVVETPVILGDQSVDVGISIGMAFFPYHGTDSTAIMNYADLAMYKAKRSGSGYTLLGSREKQESLRSALLPGQLRQAVENDELLLHHQPKVDMRSGRVIGVEALVRWLHPDHGYLMPSSFIPAAERTAVIKPFTLAVLRKALEQNFAWRQAGLELTLAVNVSARVLHDWELPRHVFDLLEQWSTPPDGLILEIKESGLMTDPERAIGAITRLCSIGVGVSIDDFGAGYSSLRHLKKMPITEIKIDMSFIHDMAKSPEDVAIVRSVVALCDNLGLNVVAEGVETQEEWDILEGLGCHIAQGYYVSPPMPAEEIETWLDEWSFAFRSVTGDDSNVLQNRPA